MAVAFFASAKLIPRVQVNSQSGFRQGTAEVVSGAVKGSLDSRDSVSHLQVGRWSVSVAQTILAARLRASLAATTTTKYRSAAQQAAPRANFPTRRRRTNPRVATLRQGLFLWLFLFSPMVNDSDGQPVVRLQWVSCQEQQIAEVCFLVIEFKHAGRPMLRNRVFNAECSALCVRSAGPGGRSEAAVQRKVHNLVAGSEKKLAVGDQSVPVSEHINA